MLTQISAGAETYEVRRAAQADVPAIVALLAADQIGATRDGGADLEAYVRAFAAISGASHEGFKLRVDCSPVTDRGR